ncbi:MAG: PAS domain-containing protein [Bdellovibrionales bacterium]|nr:PAS domain-containing protein [Oligoflexia bacterium]
MLAQLKPNASNQLCFLRLASYKEEIMQEWEVRIRKRIPSTHDQSSTTLRDDLPKFLDQLSKALNPDQSGLAESTVCEISRIHGTETAKTSKFTPDEVIQEYTTLQDVLLDVFEQDGELGKKERNIVLVAMATAMKEAVSEFVNIVTEREQELADRLARASDAGKIALWEWDARTGETWRSEYHHEFYGFKNKSLTWTFSDLFACIHPDDLRMVKQEVEKVRAGKVKSYHAEYRVIWPDGSEHWLLGKGQVRLGADKSLKYVAGTVSEITERKEADAALERSVHRLEEEKQLREQFVNTLSHDLRNPLAAAKAAAQLIARHPEQSARITDLAMRVANAVNRADKMIQDLLDANRIRAGKQMVLDYSNCDLVGIARSVLDELISIHGDRFELKAETDIFGYWSADDLKRVFENLFTNAIKYGDPRSEITLEIEKRTKSVCISVHNWGNPIPHSEIPRLFDPFSRSASAEKNLRKGSWGLGLTLVRGVVEAHRGTIEVKSSANGGTSFIISLPY